jgi:hypothetical protein
VSVHSRPFDEERDATVLGMLRAAVGLLLVVQVWGNRRAFDGGYFGDVFHLPLVPEALVPSYSVYVTLKLAALAGGMLAMIGFHGRWGLLISASIGLFFLLANRLDYHNNRFALLLVAFLTAFMPCDRSMLLLRDRFLTVPAAGRAGPTFAVTLLRLTVSAVYLSSGGGKLLDPDWRGGQTMLLRFTRGFAELTERFGALPEMLAALASSPLVASIASKSAITLELFLAVALWVPKVRPLALYAGALFHLSIELSARVELFSCVMAAAYVAFVVPEVRERVVELDPTTRMGRFVARWLPLVDWLARFQVEVHPGRPLAVRDRSGARHQGMGAVAELSRATPALFPLWLPLLGVARLTRPRSAP